MKKKSKKGKGKLPKSPVMPGFDYGVDRSSAVITPPVFNEKMRDADIIACAYGQMRAPGIGSVVPCISMVARNPAPLKEAFQQFSAWIEATGADALKVEILYSDEGYYIAFGPEYQHALWRTVGIDQFSSPLFYGFTYIKTIDSRQTVLDDIAEYSKRPFAPIMLLGAHFTGSQPRGMTPNPSEIQPIPDCPDLLLFNLPVYKTNAEVPKFSGLRIMVSKPTKDELKQSRNEYLEQTNSPKDVGPSRERRLLSLMPTTLHMLRTYAPLQQKIAVLAVRGVARWQIEQAIVNQRLWSLATTEQRGRFQNPNDLYRAVAHFAEIDTPNWDNLAEDGDAILSQVLRDARALLKKIGAKAPAGLADCQQELSRLGYVQNKNAA
jgi:hypothetical protein